MWRAAGVHLLSTALRVRVGMQCNRVWCIQESRLLGAAPSIAVNTSSSTVGAMFATSRMALLQHEQPYVDCGTKLLHSMRRISSCSVSARNPSDKPDVKRGQDTSVAPAAGLGLVGMLGLFGKRLVLILGGKKAVLGIFSVVSFKKLLFLPAWATVLSVSAGLCACYWASQTEVPITARQRALLITEAQEIDMGEKALHALLRGGCDLLPKQHPHVQRCRKVANKVVHALGLLLPAAQTREWIFVVAKSSDAQIEACSIAPGFVLVSQGLMQMCTTDAQLAFVLGHEIGHVLARHAAEKQSRYALWDTLMHSLEQSVGVSSDEQVLDLLLHLPLSRELELEADDIALALMSKVADCTCPSIAHTILCNLEVTFTHVQACYDIDGGTQVFSKMQTRKLEGLEWVQHWSTHPSFDARIARMQARMSEVGNAFPCYHRDQCRNRNALKKRVFGHTDKH
eukprot:jgi/Ulvmu1/5925/UM026_0047.1